MGVPPNKAPDPVDSDDIAATTTTTTMAMTASGPSNGDCDESVTMESVLRDLGALGKYQLIQICCACLALLPYVFVILNFVFIVHEPSHKCYSTNETSLLNDHDLVNDTTAKIAYSSCGIDLTSEKTGRVEIIATVGCANAQNYTEKDSFSMVTEWGLVCEKRSLGRLLQTLITVGMAFGSVVFTSVADRIGRKNVYVLCLAALLATELSLVFARSIFVAYCLRFFSGVFSGGMIFLQLVPCMELVVAEHRQIFGMTNCIWRSFCLMILSGVAYSMRDLDWRYLQLVTALSCIPALIGSFFMNETPAWYFAKGRHADAKRILTKASKVNGKSSDDILNKFQACIYQAKSTKHSMSSSNADYSLFNIIRNRQFFFMVSIVCIIWFTNSLAYYGLFLTSSTLAGDRFLNFFLMAALELPSSIVSMILLHRLERRTVVLIFTAMSGLCLLVSTILVGLNSKSAGVVHTSTAFSLLGKFAVGSCYNVVYAYTPEVFPTTIRSTGTSICSSFARVGAMLAPFMFSLFHIVAWAPGAILTSLCLVSFLIVPLLPETRGKNLPTTIEDVLKWNKGKTIVLVKDSDDSVSLRSV